MQKWLLGGQKFIKWHKVFIQIKDGKAKVSEQGMGMPVVKQVYKRDKSTGKASFEKWMKFVFHSYDKNSIYKN